jgi:hypothetical protein
MLARRVEQHGRRSVGDHRGLTSVGMVASLTRSIAASAFQCEGLRLYVLGIRQRPAMHSPSRWPA